MKGAVYAIPYTWKLFLNIIDEENHIGRVGNLRSSTTSQSIYSNLVKSVRIPWTIQSKLNSLYIISTIFETQKRFPIIGLCLSRYYNAGFSVKYFQPYYVKEQNLLYDENSSLSVGFFYISKLLSMTSTIYPNSFLPNGYRFVFRIPGSSSCWDSMQANGFVIGQGVPPICDTILTIVKEKKTVHSSISDTQSIVSSNFSYY